MKRRRVFTVLVGVLLFGATALAAGASSQIAGELTQLAGTDGCVSDTGTGGNCVDGKALDAATAVTVSPNGSHVYAAAFASDAVAVFARNPITGAVSQLAGADGCVSDTGSGGDCADGTALDDVNDVAVSPDGNHVYTVSLTSDAVVVFARDQTTGTLTQLAGPAGCVSEDGTSGLCVDGKALDGAAAVTVSGDGRNVYVASAIGDEVAVFTRDRATGALTQLGGAAGCVSETGNGGDCADGKALDGAQAIVVSPDGKNVYAASFDSNAVAAFARNKKTGALTQLGGTAGCVSDTGSAGACADGKALVGPSALGLAVSPDGKHVYVGSYGSDAVAVFSRNKRGALSQLAGTAGCVSDNGTGGDCVDGKALLDAGGLEVSRDGRHVYVSSFDAIAAFARDKKTGALSQLGGTAGCVSGSGGDCAVGKALQGAYDPALSRDGKHLYVVSFTSDAVAVFARE